MKVTRNDVVIELSREDQEILKKAKQITSGILKEMYRDTKIINSSGDETIFGYSEVGNVNIFLNMLMDDDKIKLVKNK